MTSKPRLYFFTCSVSEDLYGVSASKNGAPLPTPSGGIWHPVNDLADLGAAAAGFDDAIARHDIERWGCHWFTSVGPREINWGINGPPKETIN